MSVERTEDHRYFITSGADRIEAVSTTRAIIEANIVDDEFFNDSGRMRGKVVHSFVEEIATKNLQRPIDVDVLPYLQALRKALDDHKPKVIGAEVVLGNIARLYAGTMDLELVVKRDEEIWEVKTSQPEPWHGLQLAAYAYLKAGPKWLKVKRKGLYLRPTGGYTLKPYDDHCDLDYFFRALDLLHWRIERGTYERPYGRRGSRTGSDRSRFDVAGGNELPTVDDEFGQWGSVDDGDSPF